MEENPNEPDPQMGVLEDQSVKLDRGMVWDLAMARISANPKLSIESALSEAVSDVKRLQSQAFVISRNNERFPNSPFLEKRETHVVTHIRSMAEDPLVVEIVRETGHVESKLKAQTEVLENLVRELGG